MANLNLKATEFLLKYYHIVLFHTAVESDMYLIKHLNPLTIRISFLLGLNRTYLEGLFFL